MKNFFKKIKGWLCGWKFWVLFLVIIVGTVLFGSFVLNWGSVIFNFFATFMGWIATAFKWLAGVLNFFGWYGIF